MINKEDIQKAKQRAESIQTANLKSNEKSIQETQKFYETLETCIEILEQIKKGNNTITSNQKVLNDNMLACSNNFETMSNNIDKANGTLINAINGFKETLNGTSQDIKRAIHNDITENIQNEIGNVRDNINSFNSEMGHNKTDILDMINTFKTELENNRKEFKKAMEKETRHTIIGNKFLFFFFIIFSIIPSLYCLNWQFNFIPVLSQPLTSEYIKGLITIPIALIVLIIIITLFSHLFNKEK